MGATVSPHVSVLNDAWRRAFEEGVASEYGDHYLRDRLGDVPLAERPAVPRRGRFPAPATIEYRIFAVG